MEKRFGGLRFIAGLYTYGSILVFMGAAFIAAVDASMSQYTGNRPGTLGIILTGIAVTVSMAAFGQLIRLLLAIEENTRASSNYLERLTSRQRPASDVPSPTMEQLRGAKSR